VSDLSPPCTTHSVRKYGLLASCHGVLRCFSYFEEGYLLVEVQEDSTKSVAMLEPRDSAMLPSRTNGA
jgi:hypothetical protein